MKTDDKNIVLFHPHIPKNAIKYVTETLKSRWIGQGPKVDLFESEFKNVFAKSMNVLSTGSGTDSLHLSYILAGLKEGDEVVAPLFTCTATNIALKYLGVKVIFADIQLDTMNIDPVSIRKVITPNTKAIVCVHYGGIPCDMDEINKIAVEYSIPVIEDAAHALGAKFMGEYVGNISDFTMFSFQAIKHLTTGDGGMITFKGNNSLLEKAKRLRWFGIDRSSKQKGIWENDIKEIGYKYQMTDISASMGLAGLEEFNETLILRQNLFNKYIELLKGNDNLRIINKDDGKRINACWMITIIVNNRERLVEKLRLNKIESAQVHYRNDRYTIFGGRKKFTNMDSIEDNYLVLPLHTKMRINDIERVCEVINSGW